MRPERGPGERDPRGEDTGAGDASAGAGTRALLQALAFGDPDERVRFRDVFAGLGERAFGMLLFVAILPAFIPIPVGGAVSGPLSILIGAQLLIGLHKPWLPGWIGRRGPHRRALVRFDALLAPWLGRLEHLVRPRWPALLDHRLANALSGLLLVLLGLLLALPIPLTNYLFGVLLLLFALALLERDGALMTVAWGAGAVAVLVFGVLSGNLATLTMAWLQRWF